MNPPNAPNRNPIMSEDITPITTKSTLVISGIIVKRFMKKNNIIDNTEPIVVVNKPAKPASLILIFNFFKAIKPAYIAKINGNSIFIQAASMESNCLGS